MQLRTFGRTGMQISVLGFGCGAVGGLMVRGDPADQDRTIARAIEAGVNYFDTAVQYGNGESENNLGRVLQNLKPADVIVGTKVRVPPGEFGRIAETVKLSRRTHALLWQNITLALGIKAVFFVLAVFGSATMWMAVFADMGASLLVVANGLRLLRMR